MIRRTGRRIPIARRNIFDRVTHCNSSSHGVGNINHIHVRGSDPSRRRRGCVSGVVLCNSIGTSNRNTRAHNNPSANVLRHGRQVKIRRRFGCSNSADPQIIRMEESSHTYPFVKMGHKPTPFVEVGLTQKNKSFHQDLGPDNLGPCITSCRFLLAQLSWKPHSIGVRLERSTSGTPRLTNPSPRTVKSAGCNASAIMQGLPHPPSAAPAP